MNENAEEPDHAGLLRPFLASRFRGRYDNVRPESDRRTELFNKLCHRFTEVLDWRYARQVASPEEELRSLGAPSRCYCLCAPKEMDGRMVPLTEALTLVGSGLPLLLVCRPGSLAYFEPEYERGPGQRYILQLPGA